MAEANSYQNVSGVDPLYGQSVQDLNAHDRRQYEEWVARDTDAQLRLGQEEVRKNELERAQFMRRQDNETAAAQKSIKKPSFLLYIPFFYAMFALDVLDIADLTGIGAVINRIIQIFAFIISAIVSHHAGKKIKQMSEVHTSIQAQATQVAHRVAVYRQRYATALRYGRKLGLLKRGSVGARAVLKISKVTKFTRAPGLKNLVANIAEFSPLGILPWQFVSAVWTYIDHRGAYKAARKHTAQAVAELAAARVQEADEFNQSQVTFLESILTETEGTDQGNEGELAA